jgi:hypothetical protein
VTARVSCKHRGKRWRWHTLDASTGEVCEECLRAVVLSWDDLASVFVIPALVPTLTLGP